MLCWNAVLKWLRLENCLIKYTDRLFKEISKLLGTVNVNNYYCLTSKAVPRHRKYNFTQLFLLEWIGNCSTGLYIILEELESKIISLMYLCRSYSPSCGREYNI